MRDKRTLDSNRSRRSPLLETLEPRTLCSTTFYVSLKGSDANAGTDPTHAWRHIQYAFDVATPGSTVDVLPGTYHEKLTLNVSGDAVDGFTTFQAMGKVTIDGRGVAGSDIIYINNHNYVRIQGFNICDDLHVNNGSGIRLVSADDHIELLNNRIYNITGLRATAIAAYGTDPVNGISNLTISGNEAYACHSFPSETIVLNGNVHDFTVTNNYVHDVVGIGIDFIGGEGMSPDPSTDMARNGVVNGNRVTRARPGAGGSREAVGIMVDGAQNVLVEKNVCWADQIGIEVGCVHPAAVAMNDIVRDNLSYSNTNAGLSIGGAEVTQGRVSNCQFLNNTLYHNDTRRDEDGQLRVQYASGNLVENNLIVAAAGTPLIDFEVGAGDNSIDYNLLYAPGGAARGRFMLNERVVIGLNSWRSKTSQDVHSLFAAPIFTPPRMGYLRLAVRSPGVNAGDPNFMPGAGETDIAGQARVQGGRVDVGAYEVG